MVLTKHGYVKRLADAELSEMLKSFGAVCVEGPRWCGKTWTSLNHANSVFCVADPADNFSNRSLVSNNVEYAFGGEVPHLIDEWQEFPSIWDATKLKVDEAGTKGRYILTGSSTPLHKGVIHSGIGRIGTVKMRTMSLFESGDSTGEVSLSSFFRGEDIFSEKKEVSLEDLIHLTVRGGWPGLMGVSSDVAIRVNRDYVTKVARDAAVIDGKARDERKMRMFVKSLARNESTVAANTTISDDISEYEDENVSEQTVSEYTDVLTRMFVIDNQPSFSPNIRSPVKVGKKPKRHLTDPSLAVAALELSEEQLMKDLRTFGFLFEALAIRDLSIYARANGGSVSHYRDDKGREADAVVEWSDGRWGAFEVKTGTAGVEGGVGSLKSVRKVFEDRGLNPPEFLCVICGTAPAAYRRQDGVYVVPVTSLKNRLSQRLMHLQISPTFDFAVNSKVKDPRPIIQSVRVLSMSITDAVSTVYAPIFE